MFGFLTALQIIIPVQVLKRADDFSRDGRLQTENRMFKIHPVFKNVARNSRGQFSTVSVRMCDILPTSSKVGAFALESVLILNPEMFELAS